MFMGEFHHTLDEKGRMILPARFREELGKSFVVTRGLEGCLFVYSQVEWNKIIEKLKKLPFTKKDVRNFLRFFLSGATIVEADKQGRINISPALIEHANLKKECVVVGVNDRLEIWANERWEHLFNGEDHLFTDENISEIAENLFTSNDVDM